MGISPFGHDAISSEPMQPAESSSAQPNSSQSVTSQWDNFLRNLGEWRGSFTRMSPQGTVERDSPSTLVLAKSDQDASVRLTLRLFDPDTQAVEWERVLDFYSTGANILYFEDGAFSRGALNIGPFSQVGSEFCLMAGDRRLRLVQLYGTDACLSQITLIREQRSGSDAPERPPLVLDSLLGTWEGDAITRYADQKTIERYSTQLVWQQQGDRLFRHWQTPYEKVSASGYLAGNTVLFEAGERPMQILLLPDGGSSTTPLQALAGQPFRSEMGWLLAPGQRQRLIRSYDAQGNWLSATKITERQVSGLPTSAS